MYDNVQRRRSGQKGVDKRQKWREASEADRLLRTLCICMSVMNMICEYLFTIHSDSVWMVN